jgi:Flp pilus assembly protein TadD
VVRWIASLLAAVLFSLSPAAFSQDNPGGFDSLDALLDALEQADEDIEQLSAKLIYEREYALAGDTQERSGSLAFLNITDDEGETSRAFAVVFDTTTIGDRRESDGRTFVFDGRWLTERIPEEQLVLKREVAPPGAKFDPLKIGEGPLPLPLGQKKADILANYDARLAVPSEGIEHREDLIPYTNGCAQLVLVPNAERFKDDQFDEIRLWYKTKEAVLLPRMAMTLNKTGDEVVVRLWDVKLNDKAEVNRDSFDSEVPDGWDVDIERFRGEIVPVVDTHAPVLAVLTNQPEMRAPAGAEPEFVIPKAVERIIEAPYTTEDEAKNLRVFHGFWTEDDLDTPARRAQAFFTRGDYTSDAFDDETVPTALRAEAYIARGDIQDGLELLDGDDSYRAIYLRTAGLEALGKHEDAATESQRVVKKLISERTESAADLTDGVRTLIIRARLVGPERNDGTDFRTLMDLLTRAKGELDRLYWPATLAEAQLLYAKDERASASQAAMAVLKLNPQCSRAWHLLGMLAVDSFDFERAESISDRLDELGMTQTPPWVDPIAGRLPYSPLGALVLGKARIRQGDSAGAVRIVEEAFVGNARNRDLYAMLIAAEASRFEFDRAKELLNELDLNSPGTERGYLLAGWALSERRQYAESSEMLEEAMRRQPNLPESAILLGLLELQSGRDLNALTALRRVAELDPFNARANNSLELLEEIVGYDTVESEHFIVRYKPGIDEILAREMTEPLEHAHARICGKANGGIDHEPSQKTVIELMPDHAWFAVRIAGMPQIHTIAASTGPVIAMEVPRAGAGHKAGYYDWRRVIAHEYVHTVTLSRTKNRLPHWFTEAAAQYLEDAPRDERTCRLLASKLETDGLFAMDEINIKFTRPETQTDRAQAYAQGQWMYEYMVERFGDDAPLKLMDAYAEGRTEDEAMPSELGVTSEQFLDEFKDWALDEAEAWGVLHADKDSRATESAVQLMLSTEDWVQSKDSLDLLREWAEAVPVAEEPHRLLSRYYLGQEDAEQQAMANEHLEFLDARAQYTPAYAASLAKRYAESGEKELAFLKAERAVSIAPYDADQRELAARVALVAGKYVDAERHLDALVKLEPDRPQHVERLERVRELIKVRG